MPGSIRRRGDRGPDAFELRVYLGRDHSGRIRQKSVLFHGTKRAAERELARLSLTTHERPDLSDPTDDVAVEWGIHTTINQAIEGWRANGWQDLSPSTTLRYNSIWKVQIRDSIGTREIASLGPYELERYFRSLKASGLSRASVRQTRALLHRACRLARKWSSNLLPNPVVDTEIPDWKLDERREAVRAPTAEEVQLLIAAAKRVDETFAVFLRVVASTGARRGEICALRWNDIDFAAGTIRIDESVVAASGGAQIKSPKTRAGIRTIAIDQGALENLRMLRHRSTKLCVVAELDEDLSAFVFSSRLSTAEPPHPDSMSHRFRVVRAAARVDPDLHIHSLRHFQATVLDSVLTESQKQMRLGWSTVHMARHYTDKVPTDDRRAADHIGRLLGHADFR